jgi:hypothetical protein
MSSSSKNKSRDDDASLGPSTSSSSMTTTNLTGIRRSDRLQGSQVRTQSSSRALHRTVSGGIGNVHSPRLSSRRLHSSKRDGLSDLTQVNVHRNSLIATSDIRMTDEESDEDGQQTRVVSFELSDDEANGLFQGKPRERLRPTRTEVLTYFTEEPDGYKCSICNEVSFLLAEIPLHDQYH